MNLALSSNWKWTENCILGNMKNRGLFHTYPLHRYWRVLLPGFLYRTSSKSKRDKVKYLSLVSIEAEMWKASECAQFSHKHLTHQSTLHSWHNYSSWLSTLNPPGRCHCPPWAVAGWRWGMPGSPLSQGNPGFVPWILHPMAWSYSWSATPQGTQRAVKAPSLSSLCNHTPLQSYSKTPNQTSQV